MKTICSTSDATQTEKLGKVLAQKTLTYPFFGKGAIVLGLVGDLGGGKTTFLQGFAKGLGVEQKIFSPTFVIMRKYELPNIKSRTGYFYHIDCYRIKKLKEMLNLGFLHIISRQNNIVAIEWADRIKRVMPETTTWIDFEFISKNVRKITIDSPLNI